LGIAAGSWHCNLMQAGENPGDFQLKILIANPEISGLATGKYLG